MSGELASERWSPAQRVESVLISILSLLDDAEPSSPANVDAAIAFRNKPELYRQLVKADVERSKLDIPKGFVMPTHTDPLPQLVEKEDDDDFWADSDAESDLFDCDSDSNNDLDMQQSSGSDMDDDMSEDESPDEAKKK